MCMLKVFVICIDSSSIIHNHVVSNVTNILHLACKMFVKFDKKSLLDASLLNEDSH